MLSKRARAVRASDRFEFWRKLIYRVQQANATEDDPIDRLTTLLFSKSPQAVKFCTDLSLDRNNPSHRAFALFVAHDIVRVSGLTQKGRPKGMKKWDRDTLLLVGSWLEALKTIYPEISDRKAAHVLTSTEFASAAAGLIDSSKMTLLNTLDVETVRKRLAHARKEFEAART